MQKPEMVVLDIGWLDVKGTLRYVFENIGCQFISHTYINAPSAGPYHVHPDDCWIFYKDRGKVLKTWSYFKINNCSYPIKLISQHLKK